MDRDEGNFKVNMDSVVRDIRKEPMPKILD